MNALEFISRLRLPDFPRSGDVLSRLAEVQSGGAGDGGYFTIEGMRGQEFSAGIFVFMLIGVLVFVAIIFLFVWMARKESALKTGEKIMFLWIVIGTIVAVIFGGLQLLNGVLF